ncbi:MAG: tyrosine-type recombinase/integrase [Verrucomicrobia bacterium]|nr:tyrosine-type recombinase/integrase [Verrucomicrobiota bacterium]
MSPYPARPSAPWKLEIKASFAGKKIRRFFQAESQAFEEGARMVSLIRENGTRGLQEEAGLTVAQAASLWSRSVGANSKSHRDKVAAMEAALVRQFRGRLDEVLPMDVDRWLRELGRTETSRAMWFRYARMFFRWCCRMRFIDRSPLEGLRAPRSTPGRNILSPAQMKALLQAPMSDEVMALVLLGGFAGLRTIEVARMNWEDIDTKTGQIHVRPEVSKQHEGMLERVVDMTEPLAKRRKFFEKKTGRIVAGSTEALHEKRRKVALALGWGGWPDNALRHSFATYHLGRCGNAGLTAFQMGHTSPTLVQRVYAVPAVRADWKAWWRI